jgi:hypothetical protein
MFFARQSAFIGSVLAILFGTSSVSAQSDDRKAFIGLTIGPSIPFGAFADKSNQPAVGHAKLGYNSSLLNLGRRFGKHFGVAATLFYNEHDIDDPAGDDWWQVAGITAGPMYSRAITDKTILDLKLKLGLIATTQVIDSYENKRGSGLATDARASLRYNVLRRWCLLAEGGVLVSNQSFDDGSKVGFRALISGFGVAYRPSW